MSSPHVRVSATLRAAVWARRAAGEKQAELARRSDNHPTTVSALLNGLLPIRHGDPRVLRLAEVVGVRPEDAFAVDRRGADE